MAKTAARRVVEDDATDPVATSDQKMNRFLKLGPIALAVIVLGFGLLYFLDQRTPHVPSIVEQQIGRAEQAVRDNPNDVSARLTLGVLYQDAGRLDEARTQFDEVLKVAPDNADARMARASVLMDKGDLLGATAEYKTVVESFGEGEFAGADTRLQAAQYWLGIIALKQNQPQQAIEWFDKALVINPTDSDALAAYGQALGQLGRHEDAIAVSRKALTFVPTGWCDPYQQMHDSYAALGQPEQAAFAEAMAGSCTDRSASVEQLTALADGPAGVDAMLGLGQIAQVAGASDVAIEWYTKVLAREPDNATATSALADLRAAQ